MKTMRRKAARPAIRRHATTGVADPFDLSVSPRVMAAVGRGTMDDAALRVALLELANRVADRAHVSDAAVVDDLAALALRAWSPSRQQPACDGDFALRLSMACFTYLDRIGRHAVRSRFADQVLLHVDRLPGASSRCAGYHFAAVACLSADDPKRAWAYAERAYDLASGFETSAGRFKVLILVTQILDSMGLLRDARNLALQLADFPDGLPALDTLHLVNATHGLSICHRLDDMATACRFHDVARAKAVGRLIPDSADLVARFEAARAVHLARIGRARSAARILDRVIDRMAPAEGRRAEALLRWAEAEVNMVLGVAERMDRSLLTLKDLLADMHPVSTLHQEIQRTIVRLALRRDADGDREVAMHYLHQLRDQPSLAGYGCGSASDLLTPRVIPCADEQVSCRKSPGDAATFIEVGSHEGARDFPRRLAGLGLAWPAASADMPTLSRPELEASLRTRCYQVAEDWAVIAEIARGGDGRRCFKVGQVAAAVAAALGFSIERCVLIELGCRLRNIGHATLVRSQRNDQQGGAAGYEEPGMAAMHANAGERMLSFSADPVLRLATRIARSHHACWNGTGYPASRAEAIPIEARICAVADTLIDLVDPIGARRAWPIDIALKQMRCMAGVQLDPELVDLLARVLDDEGSGTADPALRWESPRARDAFVEARKELFEKLALAA